MEVKGDFEINNINLELIKLLSRKRFGADSAPSKANVISVLSKVFAPSEFGIRTLNSTINWKSVIEDWKAVVGANCAPSEIDSFVAREVKAS